MKGAIYGRGSQTFFYIQGPHLTVKKIHGHPLPPHSTANTILIWLEFCFKFWTLRKWNSFLFLKNCHSIPITWRTMAFQRYKKIIIFFFRKPWTTQLCFSQTQLNFGNQGFLVLCIQIRTKWTIVSRKRFIWYPVRCALPHQFQIQRAGVLNQNKMCVTVHFSSDYITFGLRCDLRKGSYDIFFLKMKCEMYRCVIPMQNRETYQTTNWNISY